jgi:hypothetical protein
MFWSTKESDLLEIAVHEVGEGKWAKISRRLAGLGVQRDSNQCRHRWNKVLRPNLKKGCWDEAEDDVLVAAIRHVCAAKRDQNTNSGNLVHSLNPGCVASPPPKDGVGRSGIDTSDISWNDVADLVAGRTGKACRERWTGYLSPEVKHGPWDCCEDAELLRLHTQLGNAWARISREIVGRTAEQVKSRYKSIMRRIARENKQQRRQCGGATAASASASGGVKLQQQQHQGLGRAGFVAPPNARPVPARHSVPTPSIIRPTYAPMHQRATTSAAAAAAAGMTVITTATPTTIAARRLRPAPGPVVHTAVARSRKHTFLVRRQREQQQDEAKEQQQRQQRRQQHRRRMGMAAAPSAPSLAEELNLGERVLQTPVQCSGLDLLATLARAAKKAEQKQQEEERRDQEQREQQQREQQQREQQQREQHQHQYRHQQHQYPAMEVPMPGSGSSSTAGAVGAVGAGTGRKRKMHLANILEGGRADRAGAAASPEHSKRKVRRRCAFHASPELSPPATSTAGASQQQQQQQQQQRPQYKKLDLSVPPPLLGGGLREGTSLKFSHHLARKLAAAGTGTSQALLDQLCVFAVPTTTERTGKPVSSVLLQESRSQLP